MDFIDFAQSAKVKILIGKGGVGKTTVTGALGLAFARVGLKVLIVEVDGRPELMRAFDDHESLGYEQRSLYQDPSGGIVNARRLTPDDALLEYLEEHSLTRFSKRILSAGLLDVIAGSIPGLREILILGKVKQLANDPTIDAILVDAPATGHAMTLLTSAAGVMDVARGGLVRSQAEGVVELLTDPNRCQVLLVTLAEELSVSETVEAAFFVEDRAGVALGPVICNQVERQSELLSVSAHNALKESGLTVSAQVQDALDLAAAFQRAQADNSQEQLARLKQELPLSILTLPILQTDGIGLDECSELSVLLANEINKLNKDLL